MKFKEFFDKPKSKEDWTRAQGHGITIDPTELLPGATLVLWDPSATQPDGLSNLGHYFRFFSLSSQLAIQVTSSHLTLDIPHTGFVPESQDKHTDYLPLNLGFLFSLSLRNGNTDSY